MTSRNYTKHPIKVLRNKNNIMQTCKLFRKRFSTLHLYFFVPNVFNKRHLPEIQDKNFMSRFSLGETVFLQKMQLAY